MKEICIKVAVGEVVNLCVLNNKIPNKSKSAIEILNFVILLTWNNYCFACFLYYRTNKVVEIKSFDIWGECWKKGPNRQKNFFWNNKCSGPDDQIYIYFT